MNAKFTLILCSFIAFSDTSALMRSVERKTTTFLAMQQAINRLPEISQTQSLEIQTIFVFDHLNPII